MSGQPTHSMTPDEIAAYRDSVDALIVACLERLRSYPLAADDAPPPAAEPSA